MQRPLRRRVTWVIATTAVLVLAGAGMVGYRVVRQINADATCAAIHDLNERRNDSTPVSDGPNGTTVVLGDSYAQGWGLTEPRQSWAATFGERVGRTVYVNAVAGSGLTQSTYCPDLDYAARVEAVNEVGPTSVVVQVGLNDVAASTSEEEDALAALVADVPAVDVVVGPPLAPQRDADDVRRIDAALHDRAETLGLKYVSLIGLRLAYQDDGVHPDQAGHTLIGEYVADHVALN